MCSSRKYPILPPQKALEFPGGVGGFLGPNNLKKCMMLNWNFQWDGGGGGSLGLRKKSLPWGGMDIICDLPRETVH